MPDILTKQDGPHPHPPTFLQFTDQSVVCFGARLFARQQSKHDPTISSFSRLYGFGISRTNVDRRRALTPTTPRCTSA